jgi:hypothetical protein
VSVTIVAAAISAVDPKPVALAQGASLTISGPDFEPSASNAEVTLGPHPSARAEAIQWDDGRIVAQLDSGVAAADIPAGESMTVTIKNTDAAEAQLTASFLVPVALAP